MGKGDRCTNSLYLENSPAGFLRSWKTWKSHGVFKWLFPGLEKSLKKTETPKLLEVMEMFYIHMLINTV